jgi:hypothetical protein
MPDGENGLLQEQPTGRPRLYATPDVFSDKAEEYFTSEEGQAYPTLSGISLFLGFSDRESFAKYADYGDDFSRTVNKARLRIENHRHRRLIDKQHFTPGIIFDLKNNHGWKDQQDLNHTGTVAVQFSTVYEQRPQR